MNVKRLHLRALRFGKVWGVLRLWVAAQDFSRSEYKRFEVRLPPDESLMHLRPGDMLDVPGGVSLFVNEVRMEWNADEPSMIYIDFRRVTFPTGREAFPRQPVLPGG